MSATNNILTWPGVLVLIALLTGAPSLAQNREAQAWPNILWITTEDMSPNLGSYGDTIARTPNLDRFARQSVRYTHAFATAPVCSPARSTLITGVYATTLGTHHLRSSFPIPGDVRGFPAYLRQRGYFCSNNVKTDYNIANETQFIRQTWDRNGEQAHWRQREPGQPFFSVFNIMTTHQSRAGVWPEEEYEAFIGKRLSLSERQDPEKVEVPPFYPDTPVIRRGLARYYDCITAMDKEAAELLRQLDEDGLADETIVFFYSDHGMGMPRGKRVLHDSGLRVPLMIRFPEKYNHLAPADPGERSERLVSFVDFAPTILSLAGLPVPDYMQGSAFLGSQQGAPRQFVFGARDRVDEAYECSRSVRDQRFLYIRNYFPHLSWQQPEGYSDQAAIRREITRLARTGQLNAAQMTYAGPRKPPEELFDTQADPFQIRNLADSPEHKPVLDKMREQARNWILSTRDLGFLPEHEIWNRSKDSTPFEMAQSADHYPLAAILSAADLAGGSEDLREPLSLLTEAESARRFWGLIALRAAPDQNAYPGDALKPLLLDQSPSVRIEAAGALAARGHVNLALPILERELENTHLDLALRAARELQFLGSTARPALPAMKKLLAKALQSEASHTHWLFIRFSLEAALAELAPASEPR